MSDKNSRSDKSSLWMEDGKTLSKSLVYAPLIAYQKAAVGTISSGTTSSKTTHPSQYMINKKTVPVSLRESSLASTLHFVSCDYHHNRATVNDAKNNGSRPLGLPDVDERIRQRAVTLMGGGINTSIPVGKKAARSKKRRRRSWETAEPFLRKSFVDGALLVSNSRDTVSFLRKLNSAWNGYVWKLLSNEKDYIGKRQFSDAELNEIEVRLGSLVSRRGLSSDGGGNKIDRGFKEVKDTKGDNMDLIGAHLKINSSNSHKSWVGKFGVLVGETTNTYRIATYGSDRKGPKNPSKEKQPKKKQRKIQSAKESNLEKRQGLGLEEGSVDCVLETNTNSSSKAMNIKILVLPKRGSVIQLILPLLSDKSKIADSDSDQLVDDAEGVALETTTGIIAIQDEAIGICISGQ